ncbi:MAG: hypothetical protein ABI882_09895 [Acidobacteriota bacterium]
MKCEQCQLELEDLLYGDASAARSAETRAHLAGCRDCRAWLGELERESEAFTRYHAQTALEPTSGMWLSVRDRMREERGGVASITEPAPGTSGLSVFSRLGQWVRRPVLLRQAMAAIALIAVTALVTALLLARRDTARDQLAGGPGPDATISQPSPSPTSPTPLTEMPKNEPRRDEPRVVASLPKPKQAVVSDEALLRAQVAKTEKAYVDTIRMLDRAIAKRKGTIDPGVFSQYETSIALIDESIDKSRAALRGRFSDPVAEQFLLSAYAR